MFGDTPYSEKSPGAMKKALVTGVAVVSRTLQALVEPRQLGGSLIAFAIIALAVVGASWCYLIGIWGSAKTVGIAVAGFFQVSDASAYAVCASRVLDEPLSGMADYAGGWCLRRPIYSTFLATILGLTGRSWLWTLLIQSAFVCLSITTLLRAASRLAGPITAILVLWLMFSFSAEHVFPTTTSESAGLALGAVGLGLLLDASRLGDQRILLLGTVCLSMALNARAGAFVVLPLLAAGIFFQSAESWRSRLSSTTLVIVGIISGFAVQSFLVDYFGGSPTASHSNFSYTLYGLSVGGKGWQQIMIDHPELFRGNFSDPQLAGRIFDLAWTNVVNSPWVIAKAVAKNLLSYFHNPLPGMAGSWFLWWLGACSILLNWRRLSYRLIGLLSVGIWVSSSVLIQDGGARVFAATWGVTVLQVSLGLHLLLSRLWCTIENSSSTSWSHELRPHSLEIGLALLLLAAIVLPLTPLRSLVVLNAVPSQGCAKDQRELIARLGHESYMIALIGENEPKNEWQMQVFASSLRRGLWGASFDKGFAELSVPATVIHGYQAMATDGRSRLGDDIRLVWRGDLGKLSGKTVSLCFQPDVTIRVTDVPYYLANTVRLVGP
jgi:hypothetical protein